MANILVLGVKIPFTSGGQDVLVGSLLRELANRGHTVDRIELPLKVEPKEGLLNQAALWRALDLSRFGGSDVDLVIATKFPSYFAKHPKKSVWLVHQHRELYELYGTRYSGLSDDPRDEALRRKLMAADAKVLGEAQYLSGISRNVCERLKEFNGLSADVLYPPLPLAGRYRTGKSEDYILSVGRLCAIKRVDLMIKALPIVHRHIKLKIVGVPDEPGVREYYDNEIDKHHLWDRVEFLGRVDDEKLLELYADALAVYYAPHDEDYGYVTLEALASGKAVITGKDSGGVLEFVVDNENGLIVEPNSDAIGHAVNKLVDRREWCIELGAKGKQRLDLGVLNNGWDSVISNLLSPLSNSRANTGRRAVAIGER